MIYEKVICKDVPVAAVVESIMADLEAEMKARLEAMGFELVAQIHDERVYEKSTCKILTVE